MHNMWYGQNWGMPMFGPWLPVVAPLFVLLALWAIAWQGLALWHSARRGEWIWFVIFLLIHTAGILEIIYLFAIAKLKFSELFGKTEHRA